MQSLSKSQWHFLQKIVKNLKFIGKCKKPQIAKVTFLEKEKKKKHGSNIFWFQNISQSCTSWNGMVRHLEIRMDGTWMGNEEQSGWSKCASHRMDMWMWGVWMLARQPESCGYVALEGPFKFMFQTFWNSPFSRKDTLSHLPKPFSFAAKELR